MRPGPSLILAFAVLAGCEQDVQDRPAARFNGSFQLPPVGGGGGGDADAGTGGDGGVSGRNVEGRVVAIEDLGESLSRAAGVPDRQVGGYDSDGALVTTVSGANGAFLLESLRRADPILLSVSGDPPSFVSLPASRAADALAPVVDPDVLAEIALSVAVEPGFRVGHALLWLQNSRYGPVSGISAEAISASPVSGPFYSTTDPIQLSVVGPTSEACLIVFLNAVPGDLEVSLFRASDLTTTETVTLPIEDGIVTFAVVETAL